MRRLLLLTLLLPLTAVAGSPQAEADKKLAEGGAKSMAEQCGKAIPTSIDWASFEGAFADGKEPYHAASWCETVSTGIYWLCDNEAGKAAVQANLSGVVCRWDPKALPDALGRRGPSFSFADGTLTAGYHWDTTNIDDSVKVDGAKLIPGQGVPYSVYDQLEIEIALKDYLGPRSSKAFATERCGKDLTIAIDWPSFLPNISGNNVHYRAVNWCDGVFEGIWNACDTEAGKAFVTSRIDTVACRWDATATPESLGRRGARLALEGTTLKAGFHWDTTNFSDTTLEWLDSQ